MHPTTTTLLEAILALDSVYRVGKFQIINGEDTEVLAFSGRETVEERALFEAFVNALPTLANDITRPTAPVNHTARK